MGKSDIKCDLSKRRLMICGEITVSSTLPFISSFLELSELGGSIDIIIANSPGGCWGSGSSMLDLILNYDENITTYALGPVCSASALLFLGGDFRYMSPNSRLLFHFGEIYPNPNFTEAVREIEEHRKSLDFDLKLLSERSNKPKSFWAKALESGDFRIDTEKALKLELINGIKTP